MKIQKTFPCHPKVTMFTPTPGEMSRIRKKEDTRYYNAKKENMFFKCRTRTFLILFDAPYTVLNL